MFSSKPPASFQKVRGWQNLFSLLHSLFQKVWSKRSTSIHRQNDLDKKLVLDLNKGRWPVFSQLKYLPRFLTPKEKSIIKLFLFFIILALCFLGIKIYLQNLEIVRAPGGEYVEALIGNPSLINPILAQANDVDMDISRLIFSGLVKYNEEGKLVPDLASDWTIDKEQKVYTFTLKKGIRWHDWEETREEFDANDVIFTIISIQDPDFKSPLFPSLKGVKVEKLKEGKIRFTLKEPFAPFLSILTFGILPEHIWSRINPANANLAEANLKPIGLGPFKFKSLNKDKQGLIKSYSLERNEDYYGKTPYLEKIIFKFYSDFREALEALKTKNVEGVSFLPKNLKEEIAQEGSLTFYSFSLPQYTAIFFNQEKNEFLKEKRGRQALALAINKEKIIDEALKKEGIVIDEPILAGVVGYHPGIKKYEWNIKEANKLLDEAGWKRAENPAFSQEGRGISKFLRQKDDKILELSLVTVDQPENQKAAEIIKEAWQDIGVKVKVEIIETAQIQKEIIKPRAFDALLYGEILGLDPDPYAFWHSSECQDPGLNLTCFVNKKVDKLIEEARQSHEFQVREQKYVEFQNILAEELPAIFLYSPTYSYVINSKIKGVKIKRLTIPPDRFSQVESWYIKTKRGWK